MIFRSEVSVKYLLTFLENPAIGFVWCSFTGSFQKYNKSVSNCLCKLNRSLLYSNISLSLSVFIFVGFRQLIFSLFTFQQPTWIPAKLQRTAKKLHRKHKKSWRDCAQHAAHISWTYQRNVWTPLTTKLCILSQLHLAFVLFGISMWTHTIN